MSGPTTVLIGADPLSVLLSAAAIRAAEAVGEAGVRAAVLRERHADEHRARVDEQLAARAQGLHAMEAEAAALEARFEGLIGVAESLGAGAKVRATRPVRPAANDAIALAAYVRGLNVLAGELQSILLTETARLKNSVSAGAPELTVPEADAVARPLSQRLLARIAHLGPTPADIEKLAQELDAALPGDRADLIATELRLRVQVHIDAAQRQRVEAATATVVRQSLKDLGYQVEDIADTLFVDGGVVHFRRRGWGDYMVRMRVDAKGAAANFNVVRAVDQGANETSVMDHLAEDRWCAEFPALLDALAKQGVLLNVTRRLEAGELPVQQVERGKLPQFADEEEAAAPAKPLAREIK